MKRGIITNAVDWRSRKLQGKITFQGLPISIENDRGSYRQGTDEHGNIWRSFMHIPYGYVRLTEGVDGDHVDVYIGPDRFSPKVFIVHQNDPYTGKYDEDKCMLGFKTAAEAKAAYLRQYDRPDYFGAMSEVDMATFKKMLKDRKGMKLKKSKDDLYPMYYKKLYGSRKPPLHMVFPPDGSASIIDITPDYSIVRKSRGLPIGSVSSRKDGIYRKVASNKWVRVIKKDSHDTLQRSKEKYCNAVVTETGQKYELSYVLDRDGNSVFKKAGEKSRIAYTKDEIHLISTRGSVFIHNHPSGLSFSLEDVCFSFRAGIDEMWAVGKEFRYKLVPNYSNLKKYGILKNTDNVGAFEIGSDIGTEVKQAESAIFDQFYPGVESGKITQAWAEGNHSHAVLKKLQDNGLLFYYAERKINGKWTALKPDEDLPERNLLKSHEPELIPIEKSKYIRKWRGKDGKWRYLYTESRGGRSFLTITEEEARIVKETFQRQSPGKGHEEKIPSPQALEYILKNTTFCMVSAGRNPNDPEDVKLTEEQVTARHNKLLSDLKSKGYVYTLCEGKYDLPEESIMIMAHDADRDDLMDIGSKYKQDSILFCDHGKNALIYTSGSNKGKPTMEGAGHEYVPEADNYYTKVPLKTGTVIKFSMKLNELIKAIFSSLGIPGNTLLKSEDGEWYLYSDRLFERFVWFRPLEKSETKKYYTAEEVKARGMRWVTIRGSRVLLQGTSDGSWVVVGGAGGKLNNLKVDNILSSEEYSKKRRAFEKKRAEESKDITAEEIAQAKEQRREQSKARVTARQEYTTTVSDIIGVSADELRSSITSSMMSELEDRARNMVENRAANKIKNKKIIEKEIEKQTEREVLKEVEKKVKSVERQALETLMHDYLPSEPNAEHSLQELLDKDKAIKILSARKRFRKTIKEIGKTSADTQLRIGAISAAVSDSELKDIQDEVSQRIETEKNIEMYDLLNAQSRAINTHIDQGSVAAINGLMGDIYGVGGVFDAETIRSLGLDSVVRAIALKLHTDGKGEVVRKALEEYANSERIKVVNEALNETNRRLKNADELRKLARDTDDAEAILSMASANGHALKQVTAAQRSLGTAVGSLRAVAHMINALEDPPADIVQIDAGNDLFRAKKRAKSSGLTKGMYSIRSVKKGRANRYVIEIPKDSLNQFFENNKNMSKKTDTITKIKRHELNDGYTPPGMKPNVTLKPQQEAGLRFFKEQGNVLLDFKAGIGKTAIGYAAAMEMLKNKGAKKVLMVVPSKLRKQAYDERNKFLDNDAKKQVVAPTENRARRISNYQKDGVIIIGHDQLRTDKDIIKNAGFDGIIVDEIHELTAGTGSSGRFTGMSELSSIPMKLGMSGTNIKNSKRELHRKIDFIDPSHTLGSVSDFERRYKGLNHSTGLFADAANDAFRKEIGRWVYTQNYTLDVKNHTTTVRVPLSAEQRKAYAESERKYRDERNKKVPGASARRDSRNYSIISDGVTGDNAKLNFIVDKMKTNHPGEKAVIHVSRPGVKVTEAMRSAKKRLESEFGKGSVGLIYGDSSTSETERVKAAFNDMDNPLRFIIGTKSLESGHNLQAGGTVTFHLDLPDSAASLDQRDARINRNGQDRDTSTYILSGNNPMDMRSEDIIESKRKEMGTLGNPREVDAMDDTGFIGLLAKYESGVNNNAA